MHLIPGQQFSHKTITITTFFFCFIIYRSRIIQCTLCVFFFFGSWFIMVGYIMVFRIEFHFNKLRSLYQVLYNDVITECYCAVNVCKTNKTPEKIISSLQNCHSSTFYNTYALVSSHWYTGIERHCSHRERSCSESSLIIFFTVIFLMVEDQPYYESNWRMTSAE